LETVKLSLESPIQKDYLTGNPTMMSEVATTFSELANHILKILEDQANKERYVVINKNMFFGTSLEQFFTTLTELKKSGRVVFEQEYTYKAYSGFGDITPKQYNVMEILLKLSPALSVTQSI